MSLNESIKNKRQELKLSQEYIADQLGVSRQAVSKWETGQSEPTARNLTELAALFEISLSELVDPVKYSEEHDVNQKKQGKKRPDLIRRTNLSMLAIAIQTGFLYSCTQISYNIIDEKEIPDYRLTLIKVILLCVCSLWMIRNLMYEKDITQRKKNIHIELLYCIIQFIIALFTFYFKMGIIGLSLMIVVLLFYILYINPKYMKRPFGKKNRSNQKLTIPNLSYCTPKE